MRARASRRCIGIHRVARQSQIDDKLIKGYIHWSKGLCGKGDYDEAIATLHDGIAKCPEYKKVFLGSFRLIVVSIDQRI